MTGEAATTPSDRSAPRAALKSGDLSRDGRGRIRAMPPILHYGFRPFFFLAALHAGLTIPAWLGAYFGGYEFGGPFGGMHWHAHEMLFGYMAAIVTGFVLTAIPNRTGRLPLSGIPLLVLVGLWLAGRVACLLSPDPWLAMAVDLAFPAALSFAIWREVVAGKTWKNAPVAVMITLLGLANALDHLAGMGFVPHDLGQRLALANRRNADRADRRPHRAELHAQRACQDGSPIASRILRSNRQGCARIDCCGDGRMDRPARKCRGRRRPPRRRRPACRETFQVARLATFREPILFVLHVGYGWLALSMSLLGLAILAPEAIPRSAPLHALTAGAVGTMTLAVMTRASLGHTGREIVADRFVIAMYMMVCAGALLRVAAPFAGDRYMHVLGCGGALWSGAFLLFAARYAPVLWGRRAGG